MIAIMLVLCNPWLRRMRAAIVGEKRFDRVYGGELRGDREHGRFAAVAGLPMDEGAAEDASDLRREKPVFARRDEVDGI